MRTFLIAGNWKMNPATAAEAVELAQAVRDGIGAATDVRAAICPPAIFLSALDTVLEGSPIGLGSQNMHHESKGAYTGELSGLMLLDAGCTHVILGHSERRHGLGEDDPMVNAKLKAALDHKLLPIVCIGETLAERQEDRTDSVVQTQLAGSLADLTAEQMAQTTLAYEPVWAIGTGQTATPDQAQAVHAMIRKWIANAFDEAIAERVVIQYGGSVKPENAAELLACPDIDGALVGGASLKADAFLGIVQAARQVASS